MLAKASDEIFTALEKAHNFVVCHNILITYFQGLAQDSRFVSFPAVSTAKNWYFAGPSTAPRVSGLSKSWWGVQAGSLQLPKS